MDSTYGGLDDQELEESDDEMSRLVRALDQKKANFK
jgi:hypothetical protein